MDFWNKFKNSLSEDYLREAQRVNPTSNYKNSPQLFDQCLSELEGLINNIRGQSLKNYGQPSPQMLTDAIGLEFLRETSHDRRDFSRHVNTYEPCLTDEQRVVYETVLNSVSSSARRMFFLDAPGSTGKTFSYTLF